MRSVTLNFADWLEAIFWHSFWHISRLGSGTPHWTHMVAREGRQGERGDGGGGEEGGEETDIKSNNPHLTHRWGIKDVHKYSCVWEEVGAGLVERPHQWPTSLSAFNLEARLGAQFPCLPDVGLHARRNGTVRYLVMCGPGVLGKWGPIRLGIVWASFGDSVPSLTLRRHLRRLGIYGSSLWHSCRNGGGAET